MKKSRMLHPGGRGLRRLRLMGLTALLVLMAGTAAWARVGGPCVNCHTMHNMQNGSSVVDPAIGGPLPALTNTDCVGCHSSESETIVNLNDGTRIPIVYTSSEPNLEQGTSTSMLAGGNFHWVAKGDTSKGHNVFRISAVDSLLKEAPGGTVGAVGACYSCHGSLSTLRSGCSGCHLPAHHADDSAPVVTAAKGSYRFLGNVMLNVFAGWPPEQFPANVALNGGVSGIEDPDWEQTVSSTKHNVYAGTASTYSSEASFLNKSTIGQMCAGCHGNFHHQMNKNQTNFSGVWIRHPSDVLIPNEGEYQNYKNYNPLAPVAKPVGDLADGMQSSALVEPGKDIVTCISCHRPHGSKYNDMLRWDYDTCVAGTANDECGCYVCHTAKDK